MKLLFGQPLIALALVLSGLNSARAEDFPGLREPLKTVARDYLVIQQKLAADSFDGLIATATNMKSAMAMRIPAGVPTSLPFESDFFKAVDNLLAAKDLHAARLAFQQVSNGLIAALAQNQAQTGSLHSAYCPMIKAYWVQTDGKVIHNPYYGAAMSDCGEIQRQF